MECCLNPSRSFVPKIPQKKTLKIQKNIIQFLSTEKKQGKKKMFENMEILWDFSFNQMFCSKVKC